MNELSETWFVEGNIDFESKKYTLLAYLQRISRQFSENKLYPQLADVIFHYRNLLAFKENKKLLQSRFPQKLTGMQLENLQLIYEEMAADSELMEEIEHIVFYALQRMKGAIAEGTDLYDFVEESLTVSPVGVLPLDTQEGYFFLCDGKARAVRVYEYRLSLFETSTDNYRALRSQFVSEWERNLVNTYESIKRELLRVHARFSLPAVYAIETPLTYPIEETLLPIAKRSLVRRISAMQ